MERQIKDISILGKYHNRQVVLNYYKEDDFIEKRDGFYVEAVSVEEKCLSFKKKNEEDLTISLMDYPFFAVNSDFQNYYILTNGSKRLEIYFP